MVADCSRVQFSRATERCTADRWPKKRVEKTWPETKQLNHGRIDTCYAYTPRFRLTLDSCPMTATCYSVMITLEAAGGVDLRRFEKVCSLTVCRSRLRSEI